LLEIQQWFGVLGLSIGEIVVDGIIFGFWFLFSLTLSASRYWFPESLGLAVVVIVVDEISFGFLFLFFLTLFTSRY